jgi:hypothetical protein
VVPDLWVSTRTLKASDPAFSFEDFATAAEGAAVESYRVDRETIRGVLSALVDDPVRLRADVREALPRWLRQHLCVSSRALAVVHGQQPDFARDSGQFSQQLMQEFLPGARVSFTFARRHGFGMDVVPVFRTAPAAYAYGLALLVDSRRDFARLLGRCIAPATGQTEGTCGRFFCRAAPSRRRYCSDDCVERMRLVQTMRRVQRFRHERYGWSIRPTNPGRKPKARAR